MKLSEMPRGNLYVLIFEGSLIYWVEVYIVKDKFAQFSDEFTRFEALLVTDNRQENLESLNIKVECIHQFLGDILTKLSEGGNENFEIRPWKIFNQ